MATNPEVVIFDSSGLVSLLHEDDALHERATEIAGQLAGRHIDIILPAEVLAETMNVIGKRFGNATAIRAGEAIFEQHWYIPQADDAKLQATLARLADQKNSVSFIDCLVMTWADHYRTKVIFGFDGAFAAGGYVLPAGN